MAVSSGDASGAVTTAAGVTAAVAGSVAVSMAVVAVAGVTGLECCRLYSAVASAPNART